MKRSNGVKIIIIGICITALVVGYYYYLSNRNVPQPEEVVPQEEVLTVTQRTLLRNLDTNYPPTPREVIKYFSEITQCFYNEENTEEEIEELGLKIRGLYDSELVANQTQEEYLAALKEDIDEFKQQGRTIASFTLSASVDVDTFSENGYEWARLYCIYGVEQGGLLYNSNIVFILRKDEQGHYRIFGWQLKEK